MPSPRETGMIRIGEGFKNVEWLNLNRSGAMQAGDSVRFRRAHFNRPCRGAIFLTARAPKLGARHAVVRRLFEHLAVFGIGGVVSSASYASKS